MNEPEVSYCIKCGKMIQLVPDGGLSSAFCDEHLLEHILSSAVTVERCVDCGVERDLFVEPLTNPDDYGRCNHCRAKKQQDIKAKHLDDLRELSTDERLRRIEEWIYDYARRPSNPKF